MRYSSREFTIPLRYLLTKRSICTSDSEFINGVIPVHVYGNRLVKPFERRKLRRNPGSDSILRLRSLGSKERNGSRQRRGKVEMSWGASGLRLGRIELRG